MLAASNGLRVEAMTDMTDRMTRMTSRLHNGQFCLGLDQSLPVKGPAHERVIGVVGGLRDEDYGDGATGIVLQSRVLPSRLRRLLVFVEYRFRSCMVLSSSLLHRHWRRSSLPGTLRDIEDSKTPSPILPLAIDLSPHGFIRCSIEHWVD